MLSTQNYVDYVNNINSILRVSFVFNYLLIVCNIARNNNLHCLPGTEITRKILLVNNTLFTLPSPYTSTSGLRIELLSNLRAFHIQL